MGKWRSLIKERIPESWVSLKMASQSKGHRWLWLRPFMIRPPAWSEGWARTQKTYSRFSERPGRSVAFPGVQQCEKEWASTTSSTPTAQLWDLWGKTYLRRRGGAQTLCVTWEASKSGRAWWLQRQVAGTGGDSSGAAFSRGSGAASSAVTLSFYLVLFLSPR